MTAAGGVALDPITWFVNVNQPHLGYQVQFSRSLQP